MLLFSSGQPIAGDATALDVVLDGIDDLQRKGVADDVRFVAVGESGGVFVVALEPAVPENAAVTVTVAQAQTS